MEPNIIENNSGLKSWQKGVIIAVVVVIIAVIVYAWVKPKADDTSDVKTQNKADVLKESNSLKASDQYPGNVVFIDIVQLSKPGFVVVHKDNAGVPGAVIGSAYFDAGSRPSQVKLTENTVDKGTYWAVLIGDDGDKKYDAVKDSVLKNSAGTIIMQSFKTMIDLPELKG